MRRVEVSLEKDGRDPEARNISAVLPAVRLAITAWLLRLAESAVVISGQISLLLYAVEALMLALAMIIVAYWLVIKLGYMRRFMPPELQEIFPEKALNRLQRLLRLMTVLVVAEFFYTARRPCCRSASGHDSQRKVAGESVEYIGRRPSIRRLANITITYDMPPDTVERALNIIREILENHDGMQPDFSPRVFFNEFNDAFLNIIMLYWYHPPDWAAYMAFSERVNLQIMRDFEAEGIKFAFPKTNNYLAHDDRRPLHGSISGDSQLSGKERVQAPI